MSSYWFLNKKDCFFFFLFFFLACLFRFSSFLFSVIDWDESIYILMADSLRQGNGMYEKVWDNKPPFIYLLFWAALAVNDSLLSIRLLACIFVAVGGVLLAKLLETFIKNTLGLYILTGLVYLVYSRGNGGLAANCEIFFIPFVCLSFLLFLSKEFFEGKWPIRLFFSGFWMGIAFQIKYVVLFDWLAFLFICLVFQIRQPRMRFNWQWFRQTFLLYFYLSAGFLLPFLLIILIFWFSGKFEVYFEAAIRPNVLHHTASVFSWQFFGLVMWKQLKINLVLWGATLFSFIFMVFFGLLRRQNINLLWVYASIWFCFAFLGVCYTKKFYDHYFLQLLPAQCILLLLWIHRFSLFLRVTHKTFYTFLFLALTIAMAGYIFFNPRKSGFLNGFELYYARYILKKEYEGDSEAKIASYLRRSLKDKEHSIFVANHQHIIYYLSGAKIPTKYPMCFHWLDKDGLSITGLDGVRVAEQAFEQQPEFVVFAPPGLEESLIAENQWNSKTYDLLREKLKKAYILQTEIDGIQLYRLKRRQ